MTHNLNIKPKINLTVSNYYTLSLPAPAKDSCCHGKVFFFTYLVLQSTLQDMKPNIAKWHTQIKKGYLELVILKLIEHRQRLYGFSMIEILKSSGLDVKEGTLYPILSRMTTDTLLIASWETNTPKGHPRKFYKLSSTGKAFLDEMEKEFNRLGERDNK